MSTGASEVARLLKLVDRISKLELAKPDLVKNVRVDVFEPILCHLKSIESEK